MNAKPYTVEQYLLGDYPRTLFPLTTTALLVDKFSQELLRYLYTTLLPSQVGFPAQQRCYAAKRGHNLRRTMKLDPVAELFAFDVVFRNRKAFRPDHRKSRASFGYRFSQGLPQGVTGAYAEFKSAIASARRSHTLTLKADVATYFNSIYHHDLVNTIRGIGWPESDVEALGRFLREINSGRSVDCLPQGLHPCKVIGSEFLRFVDNSLKLKSSLEIRFLDDMHFFDSNERTLLSDLVSLQELLGEKGLSLNDSKTSLGQVSEVDLPKEIDAIKASLLHVRRQTISLYDDEIDADSVVHLRLRDEQIEYLLHLLESPDIEESDAELVLVLLRDHAEQVIGKMGALLANYPGLTRGCPFAC